MAALAHFRAPTRVLPLRLKAGAVAQLGERLVRNEEVRGSNPLGSTTAKYLNLMYFGDRPAVAGPDLVDYRCAVASVRPGPAGTASFAAFRKCVLAFTNGVEELPLRLPMAEKKQPLRLLDLADRYHADGVGLSGTFSTAYSCPIPTFRSAITVPSSCSGARGFPRALRCRCRSWRSAGRSTRLTGSALDLGLVGLAQFVPAFLLVLVAGAVADRYDRGRVVRLAQLTEGCGRAGARDRHLLRISHPRADPGAGLRARRRPRLRGADLAGAAAAAGAAAGAAARGRRFGLGEPDRNRRRSRHRRAALCRQPDAGLCAVCRPVHRRGDPDLVHPGRAGGAEAREGRLRHACSPASTSSGKIR